MRWVVIAALLLVAACSTGPRPGVSSIDTTVQIDTTGTPPDSLPYPYVIPVLIEMGNFVDFMPIPGSVRRTRVTTIFTVDETGAIKRISLKPPKDPAFARRYVKYLLGFKFRPAQKLDGTPTVGHYQMVYQF